MLVIHAGAVIEQHTMARKKHNTYMMALSEIGVTNCRIQFAARSANVLTLVHEKF